MCTWAPPSWKKSPTRITAEQRSVAIDRNLNIHIVGAGIGGLSAALALHHFGFKPVLHEQAPALGEVGAGLTIGPNASRVLSALGLEPSLRRLAREPRHTGMLNFRTGEPLKLEERGAYYREQFGAPFWHIHRADMVDLLAGGLPESQQLHFNHRLSEVSTDSTGAKLLFANGDEAECDVLLACDGLKSPVRSRLFDGGDPEFTGFVAWRGLVERSRLPDPACTPDFSLFPGPQALVGRYAVRDRSLVNFVAIGRQDGWTQEGWMAPADIGELQARFEGWTDSVTQLFTAVDPSRCFKWALHVRPPLDRWVKGRVALLGDAAHPMTPFLGLGSAMAVEDAMVFARIADDCNDVDELFQRYQAARVERANRVQSESQKQGLYLLNLPAGQPPDQGLTGEDPLGLFAYDAVHEPV